MTKYKVPRNIHFWVVLFVASVAAQAKVLMLDFGPTEVTGHSLTNSPYHSVRADFRDTSWNVIELSNVLSGLIYSNGDAADNVTLMLGASIGSSVVDFSQLPNKSSALGAAVDTDSDGSVFAGSSVGTDGIFTSSPLGNNLVGIKIGGLPPGRYEIYTVGLNTSNGVNYQSPSVFFVSVTEDISTFETAGLKASASSSLSKNSVEAWTEGVNFVKVTVEINEGQFLVLVADTLGPDAGGSEDRGFLNAVQIVSVPRS